MAFPQAVACIAVFTALGAQTQAQAVPRDSGLDVLITQVLQRNPGLSAHQFMAAGAAQRIRPAGSLPDPQLSVGVMDLTLPHFGFNSSDFTEVDAELTQEFPWPGSLHARSRAAGAARDGAEAELTAARRDVVVTTARAYYRLRYLVTARATLAEQHRLLDAAVTLSTTRYGTGVTPESDPLQARVARDRLQSEQYALDAEYADVLGTINALRDRPATDSLAVDSFDLTTVRAPAAPTPSVDSLTARALAASPRMTQGRAAIAAAGYGVQAERLAGWPDFSLTIRYGYRPDINGLFREPDFFSAFLGIRIPLWAGRKQHRLADAARADSAAAAADLRGTAAALARDVATTAAATDAARRRLDLLLDKVLPTADATVASVRKTYEVGQADLQTLLAALDARFRAHLEAEAVAADYQTQLVTLQQLTAEDGTP